MKSIYKILVTFLSLIMFLGQGYSQTWSCETEAPETDFLTDILGISYSDSYVSRNLNIYLHIIRRTDGTGGLTNAQVTTALNILSADYASADICFTEIGRENINSDTYFNFTSSQFASLIAVNPHSNAIDIYLLRTGVGFGGRASGIPGNALVIGGDYATTSVISHEMGHCVGLYHTHSGRGCNDFVNCAEAIDGSNCATCGDRVCDTPADPCLSGQVNASCTYTGGGGFSPDATNIQSYTTPACMDHFTPGQISRIHTMISNSTILLNVLNTNPCGADCPANLTINQLLNGGNHEFLASATITANNTITNNAVVHYGANTRILLQQPFRVDAGCRFLADLNGCTAGSYKAAEPKAAHAHTHKQHELNIYPNPSKGIFTVEQNGESAYISISDLTGKVVFNGELNDYVNHIDLSTHPKGLYIVKTNVDEIIKVMKIIIE